ncbi:MAG: nucleoside hydrolase [Planctomycetaceae bacterium]|nr:nucleoside hydrolase [Planctomycetaceae bacterium]
MPKLPLIIDADPGLGSAITTALALCDPELDVLAVTACGGRTSGEQAFRNLQTVVSMIDPPRWPRLGFSSAPAAPRPDRPELSGLLINDGAFGLGNCETIEALPHAPTDSSKLLTELVREFPNELTILTLGPLTNLNQALERFPEFLSGVRGLVSVGGALNGGGNVTAAAEFNVYADPEAARNVLTSAATKTLVPLDTSARCEMSLDQFDSLRVEQYSRLGQFLVKTVPYLFRESRTQLGREGIVLPELVGLAAVSQPRLFDRGSMRIDIETSGELTTGMTVFDRRGTERWQSNIDVLVDADVVGIHDYVKRILRQSSLDGFSK